VGPGRTAPSRAPAGPASRNGQLDISTAGLFGMLVTVTG
jgi:hypothetical protein